MDSAWWSLRTPPGAKGHLAVPPRPVSMRSVRWGRQEQQPHRWIR